MEKYPFILILKLGAKKLWLYMMRVCHIRVIIERIKMKLKYKILICFIIFEFLIVSSFKKQNISFDSWMINAIGTIIFLLPILFLLFDVSKDTSFSKKKRVIAKFFIGFIICSYVLGGIVTF